MHDGYHHGDLRAQVLSTAAEIIADTGADGLSLRELARRAGVSHAAPAHHFGDRRGLFTALAAEGFQLLADALAPSVEKGEFDRTAVAYVRFAVTHAGHYAIMFRADLLDQTDTLLGEARRRTGRLLGDGLASLDATSLVINRADAQRAAWALVHGIATLAINGALPGTKPERLALVAAHQLFPPAI